MAIDIGSGAADYGGTFPVGDTRIDKTNPANETGTIDTIEIWHNTDGTDVKVGTFYGSGTSYTNRDYELIGSVASGSKQIFTGKSCDCQAGDLLGWYATSGNLEANATGGTGYFYKSGDQFGAGTQTYTSGSDATKQAVYGTGPTVTGIPLFNYHFNNMRP